MNKKVNDVGLVVQSCPYPHYSAPKVSYCFIEERFDFQIGENGKIDRISLGEFDLDKEVNSHNGEVGLINALKLAEAHGISLDSFAKTEPGLMVDLSGIDTMDDLLRKQAVAEAKLAKLAADAGVSVEELVEAVKTGKNIKVPEGGADNGSNVEE